MAVAEDVPRNTRAQLLWWATLALSLPVGLVAFLTLLGQPADSVLIQGPLVVDPTLGQRLATVLPISFLHWTQIGIHVVGFLLFVSLGVLIAARSNELVPYVAAAMLVAVGTSLFAPLDHLTGGWETVGRVVGVVAENGVAGYWLSLSGVLLLAFLLVFVRRRPRQWEWLGLAVLAGLGIVTALVPGWSLDPSNFPSPVRQLFTAGVPLLAMGQSWREYVRSGRVLRRQVRPVLTAFTVIGVAFFVLILLRPSLRADAFGLVLVTPRLQALYGINTLLLATLTVLALPVSIVLAVVRYRLFEIDVLVNRALVYGSLTGIATLTFLAVTLAISAAIGGVVGSGLSGSQVGQVTALAGVVTGTGIAIGLQPLRRRLQRSIDRRFYRDKFDAERALDQFADQVASVVDREVLTRHLATLLSATLQPASLRMVPVGQVDPALVRALEEGQPVPYPVPSTGVAMPLIGTSGVGAALILGPRLAGIPYRGLELEFLQRVADRAGPALRIVEMVENTEAARRQSERIDQEMSVARRIQRQLLPRTVPEPEGWSFSVFYEPAREVGGDFYDFYELGEGRWGVAVGDVTDKGMPAALVMASCRTVMRGVALAAGDVLSPSEVLRRSNELLVGDIPEGMFITCLYGVLDARSGHFRFANAGQNPPVWCRDTETDFVMARGMPLGLLGGMEYEESEAWLSDGEALVLTSDGVTESHSENGEMFGFDRLRLALTGLPMNPIQRLLNVQRQFAGIDWEQEDDITLITLRRG